MPMLRNIKNYLAFCMVLDMGLVHPKQLLYFMSHKNSENAVKPNLFVENLKQYLNIRETAELSLDHLYPKHEVSGLKRSKHPYNFSQYMNF